MRRPREVSVPERLERCVHLGSEGARLVRKFAAGREIDLGQRASCRITHKFVDWSGSICLL